MVQKLEQNLSIYISLYFVGKGKTPLRRSNNLAVSVTASTEQTVAQVLESSCEKSCQVTSEQIKADMKAAADNSKRNSSKAINPEAVETNGRTGASSGTVWGSGSVGGSTRTGVKAVTGSVGRVGPGLATSRHVGGSGSMVACTNHGENNAEGPSRAQGCTVEAGVSENSASAGWDRLDSAAVDGNPDSSRTALLARQRQREPSSVGSASATGSVSQQDHTSDKDFVPRRPLTRSQTRMSSVSLVPETGKTKFTNIEHLGPFICI